MIHKMNLAPVPFKLIVTGKKKVEMRLYDEKRAQIKIGDIIEFENIETNGKIRCEVTNLTRFQDFFELYAHFDKTALGYEADEIANAEYMYEFYSPDKIAKYGVLAIEIRLI